MPEDQPGQEPAVEPALSVIVITPDRYDTVQRLIACLRAQTARDQLEIVIVAPSLATLNHDTVALSDFARVQVVEASVTTTGQARAIGIRHATAPVVALSEDHAFPSPNWAATLIEAHRGPWAAVGTAIGNANPGGVVSWANLYIQHGPWVAPVTSGIVDDVSGHNSSYKRERLLPYGDRLATLMEAQTVLHWDLRARGYQLYLAGETRIDHLNMSRMLSFLLEQFQFARLFAGTRAVRWSRPHQLVYALGAPLIPLVRLPRVLRDVRRSGRARRIPILLPAMLAGLIAGAVGELVAYAAGPGDSARTMYDLEFHRDRHITAQDRMALRL